MSSRERIEALRQEGLAALRANHGETALERFDEALALAPEPDQAEILTINKARALVELRRSGPEVQALPRIVMRRENPLHTFLAAYTLLYKFRLDGEYERAGFYGRLALELVDASGRPEWKAEVLLDLGNLCIFNSQSNEAIAFYEEALALCDATPGRELAAAFAKQNLGYARMISGEVETGIALIHEAMALMTEIGAEGYIPESQIDLCYGYLELDNLEKARHYGELGLEGALEDRQIRNAHYLLGEVLFKSGEVAGARRHFETLARYYPDFPNLTNLLLAIDLRRMVNLKL
ncbi:MAG: hypothetical protein ACRD2J_17940 [Thermoanaerobaculia bacterium]